MAGVLTRKTVPQTAAIGATYQISFWLKPDGDGNDFPREVYNKIVSAVTASGGSIISETKPAKKRLAYPIKHAREAFFGNIQATLPGQAIASILDAIKHETAILRMNIFALKEKLALTPRFKRRPRKFAVPTAASLSAPTPKPERSAELPQATTGKKEESPAGVDLEALDKKLEEILKT